MFIFSPPSFLSFFSQWAFSHNFGKIKKTTFLTFFCIEMSNSDPYMLYPDFKKKDCLLPTEHLSSLQKALQNYFFKQQNKEFFYRCS